MMAASTLNTSQDVNKKDAEFSVGMHLMQENARLTKENRKLSSEKKELRQAKKQARQATKRIAELEAEYYHMLVSSLAKFSSPLPSPVGPATALCESDSDSDSTTSSSLKSQPVVPPLPSNAPRVAPSDSKVPPAPVNAPPSSKAPPPAPPGPPPKSPPTAAPEVAVPQPTPTSPAAPASNPLPGPPAMAASFPKLPPANTAAGAAAAVAPSTSVRVANVVPVSKAAAGRKSWPMRGSTAVAFEEEFEGVKNGTRDPALLEACCMVFWTRRGHAVQSKQEVLAAGKKCFGAGVEPVQFSASPSIDVATFVFRNEGDRDKALEVAQQWQQFPEPLAKDLNSDKAAMPFVFKPKERTCYFRIMHHPPLTTQALVDKLRPWGVEKLAPSPEQGSGGCISEGVLRFPTAEAMKERMQQEEKKKTSFEDVSGDFVLKLKSMTQTRSVL